MSGEGIPLFVDRQSYRRRRLADAARLMPILGAMLFFLPLFWQGGEGEESVSTAAVMAYIFGVWALLALASGLLSRHLHEGSDRPDPMREDTETRPAGSDAATRRSASRVRAPGGRPERRQ